MRSYKFIVSGIVQGVWYRKSIAQNAQKAGFSGYIKNLENGDVEAGVTLDESHYENFLIILKQGSANSKVDNIEVCVINDIFVDEFEIRRT